MSEQTVALERKIVTAIPGPKSQELHAKRLKEVSHGVGAALPVYIEKAHGATLVDVDGNQFTGTPPADFNGSIDIEVFASDGLLFASDVFRLTIDPVNDAPVLAGAQVSMAMGSGTQMARATGDVVLLTENLLEIEHALATSRFGINVIRQNFIWAIAYNLVALPFAATGYLNPWMAAIGMSISSLIVVLNALRLK